MGVQCHAPAAIPPIKRQDTQCSTADWVGLGTGLERYGKYRLNWDSRPKSSSTYGFAIPNTPPRLRYSTQLAINHRITPYPTAFPYGNATFLTSPKHRLRCGHLNTRRTEHAETWNHSLTRYFHIT